MTGLRPVPVEARGLGKHFGAHEAVRDVSFDVPAGAVTALLGGNGAGKSTSLRLMLSLARGSGTTTYAGAPLSAHADPGRVVGAFLGAPAFHPGRSVRNHLRCLAAGAGIPRGRIEEVVELLGMAPFAHVPPRRHSTGMRQRLGIASALLVDPSVLVLDEPGNGLDPEAMIGLRTLLRGHAARGGTVLLATHVLSEVELVADRVVIMSAGRVVREGGLSLLLDGEGTVTHLVRCDEPHRLAEALRARGASVTRASPDELAVRGPGPYDIARAARAADVLVVGLAPARRTVEELFVEATAERLLPSDSPHQEDTCSVTS
jgi:ABC-2 type transport system ATP-binding protein